MNHGLTRTILVRVADLNDDGAFFLDTCRRQSVHLAAILDERDGRVVVAVADSNALGSDDVPSVRVISNLTLRERALTYGMENLTTAQSTGARGIAAPIPTNEYLERLGRAYGDLDRRDVRTWVLPHGEVSARRCARLDGATIVNGLGAALRAWCVRGQFSVA